MLARVRKPHFFKHEDRWHKLYFSIAEYGTFLFILQDGSEEWFHPLAVWRVLPGEPSTVIRDRIFDTEHPRFD